jgi:hypothetical protein
MAYFDSDEVTSLYSGGKSPPPPRGRAWLGSRQTRGVGPGDPSKETGTGIEGSWDGEMRQPDIGEDEKQRA